MNADQLEAEIRRIRGAMFTLDEHDQEQAGQTIDRLKRKLAQARKQEQTKGPFSGLTRSELAATGTTETDWY